MAWRPAAWSGCRWASRSLLPPLAPPVAPPTSLCLPPHSPTPPPPPRPLAPPPHTHTAPLQLRVLGALPGVVEVEAQHGVLVSNARPLLVLPDAAAADEVRQLERCSTGGFLHSFRSAFLLFDLAVEG